MRTFIFFMVMVSAAWSRIEAAPPEVLPGGTEVGTVTIGLDRGEDLGQNFGTLFEVRSSEGRPLLGAGFLGAYNTLDRTDRHVLHVFEANDAPPAFEPLPRVNDDAGVYLFDRSGHLYARSAADGKDTRVRRWEPAANRWEVVPDVRPEGTVVAGGLLEVGDRRVLYRGESILDWPEGMGRLGRPYYGQGWLLAWNSFDAEDPRIERCLAWRWKPGQVGSLEPSRALELTFEKKREFPYAVGQREGDIVLTTNVGDVYRLRSGRWEQLRRQDGKSYQVYASLNVGDSLWLAQYPSGEVLDYDGRSIRTRPGFPPVMPGVSRSAREAQSLTIFGGDVYVGVWPWAEVWRYRPGPGSWEFVRRLFSQPAITDQVTHPYEKETVARKAVLNQWGQRVTSLVPLGEDLYISSSAKSSRPWSPDFDFLDESARAEYGRVYRVRRPGHVAAPLRWTDGPTQIRITFDPERIRITQDGRPIGEARRARRDLRPSADLLRQSSLVRQQGLFGPARVKTATLDATGLFASEPR